MDYCLNGFSYFITWMMKGCKDCSIRWLCFCKAGGGTGTLGDGGRKLGHCTAGVKAVPAIFFLAPVFFINKPSGTAAPIGQLYLINLVMLRFLNGLNPKHIPCNWLDWY